VSTGIRFAQQFTGVDYIDSRSLAGLSAEHTTIDASDQWRTNFDRPGVEIEGGARDLLVIQSDHNIVLDLMFGGSDNTGVRIDRGHLNAIGGTGTHQRNVFAFGIGVQVEGVGAANAIIGNSFGTIDGEAGRKARPASGFREGPPGLSSGTTSSAATATMAF
jgi:hypothetical protein